MNKNNMHVMVLFLLVITTTISSVLCSSSNNDEKEILMVVEEQTSSMQSQMVDQNKVQPGRRFGLKGGRSVTLSSLVNGRENYCVPPNGDPCGALDWCCEGLYCTNPIYGSCKPLSTCKSKGNGCNMLNECCYPSTCSSTTLYEGVCQ